MSHTENIMACFPSFICVWDFCLGRIFICVWGEYIAKLISSWRKVRLSTIYGSFIWFSYARIYNSKGIFWFVYKFKTKFVFIVCWVRLFFASRLIAILLLADTVSVTLVYLLYFYFRPSIFYCSNRNHQMGDVWTLFYSKIIMDKLLAYMLYDALTFFNF